MGQQLHWIDLAPGFQHDYFGAPFAELLRHHPAGGAGTDDADVKDFTLAQSFLS